jgi:Ca2+:H+ antiporter
MGAKSALAAALEQPLVSVLMLVGFCGVMLNAALAIVRHAEVLAHRLGEPFGTLLLTLAVTGLEGAMVAFVMSTGEPKPALARDTMFAVVMLVLNGFLGLTLMLGGLRHREQTYNLQSAHAFLVIIIPFTVLGLVLPNFTTSTAGPTLSTFQMVFLSLMSVGTYALFLYLQNHRHREYFVAAATPGAPADHPDHEPHDSPRPTLWHAAMLAAYGLPLVLLAKKMADPLDALVLRLDAPPALGGLIVALLVLTPESVAAVRAALANQLQRSVNILLGSVLASVGLTIPLVIGVALATDRELILGIDAVDTVLLLLTLVTSILTFAVPRTNILLGGVHLLLFGSYLMLMFNR